MRVINVEPRTPEWHAIRQECLTASLAGVFGVANFVEMLAADAAARGVTLDIEPLKAVGMKSFYETTPWTLWARKLGMIPNFQGNAHTERGQRYEDLILDYFEKTKMLLVQREVTAKHETADWLLASFDGVLPASTDPSVVAPYGFPIEAKAPAFPSRKKMFDSYKACGSYIKGLPYYWCQVQHQIYVAEAPYAWFVAVGVEEDKKSKEPKLVFPIIEKVYRDDAFLEAYIPMTKFFFDTYLQDYHEPPKTKLDEALLRRLEAEADVARALKAEDLDEVVALYKETLEAEAAAVAQRKALESLLLAQAAKIREPGAEKVFLGERLEFQYVPKEGAVSWQKLSGQLAREFGVDLAARQGAFKGKPSEQVKVTILEG